MSGGYFNYDQFKITEIAEEISKMISINDSTEKNEFGQDVGKHFNKDVINKFQTALETLQKSAKMAYHIDWLVSGDYGEDTFIKEWNKDGLE